MKEQPVTRKNDNLITEVIIPTLFTIVLLVCLFQLGMSVINQYLVDDASVEQQMAISAFEGS